VTVSAPLVRVVTAAEAAARDAGAIAAGIPSRALMQRAGAAAAAEIALRHPEAVARGVVVLCGPGNNGGDGWVVARALATTGARVTALDPMGARTADCIAERDLAGDAVPRARRSDDLSGALWVDALLGTGASGEPRGEIAEGVARLVRARADGAVVVALDLPTGVDADGTVAGRTSGADLTLTFGTLKRAHVVARPACGRVAVLDIGLGAFAERDDGAPSAVDERWVAARVPAVAHDSHKGTRGRVVIVGGAAGMAGAALLATRAALRSGAGMVRAIVDRASVDAIVGAEPAALVTTWPTEPDQIRRAVTGWAHALAIGPGLGATPESRALVERLLREFRGPVVLDADALNVFAGDIDHLGALLDGRAALVTPHQVELGRLLGVDDADVAARRFDVVLEAAARARAAVLLKGVPTVVSAADGERLVVASGNAALATGGSGDLLTGMAATLLAQGLEGATAAACAAWVHGRAAALAVREAEASSPRGVALEDVVAQLARAWRLAARPGRYPVLLELDPA
jgi:NAD(P)H-hydrate epimerase